MEEQDFSAMLEESQRLNQQGEMKFTEDEANRFKKAFADPEFRKMFAEYMDELQDPKHREETEAYITQLEGEQKVPEGKELIRPDPGFVIKTYKTNDDFSPESNRKDKLFINMVSSPSVAPPVKSPATTASATAAPAGDHWSLPYTLGPPHMEKDKQGANATCFDCCFHPLALDYAARSSAFQDMLVSTAMEGVKEMMKKMGAKATVESSFHVVKGVKYKGGDRPLTLLVSKAEKNKWDEKNKVESKGAKGTKEKDGDSDKAAVATAAKGTTKGAASGGIIKKGFLNSKSSDKSDKIPTIRPGGAAGGGTTSPLAAAPASTSTSTAGAEMREVSSKKISRPAAEAPATTSHTPAAAPASATSAASAASAAAVTADGSSGPEVPAYTVKHREEGGLGDFQNTRRVTRSRCKELVYEVKLPKVTTPSLIKLDLTADHLTLSYEQVYLLSLALPLRVLEHKAKAKFDKHAHTLTVALPVIQQVEVAVEVEGEDNPKSPGLVQETGEDLDNASTGHTTATATDAASTSTGAGKASGKKGVDHSRWVQATSAAQGDQDLAQQVQRAAELAKQSQALQKDADFVASAKFQGSRPGYVFCMGDQGLGYYRDTRRARGTAAAPAPSPSPSPSSAPAATKPSTADATSTASASATARVFPMFEVQQTPQAVALLVQVPRILPDSVHIHTTTSTTTDGSNTYSIDLTCVAISDAQAEGSKDAPDREDEGWREVVKTVFAGGWTFDTEACGEGLDPASVRFDVAGANMVVVANKRKAGVWQAKGQGGVVLRTKGVGGSGYEGEVCEGGWVRARTYEEEKQPGHEKKEVAAPAQTPASTSATSTSSTHVEGKVKEAIDSMRFSSDVFLELD
eukprot:gene29747-35920_t